MFLERKIWLCDQKRWINAAFYTCSGGVTTYISTLKALRNPAVRNQVEFCSNQYCTKLCHQGTLCSISPLGQWLSDFLFIVHFQILELGQHPWNQEYGQWEQAGLVFNKVSPWDSQNCMIHSVLSWTLTWIWLCPDHKLSYKLPKPSCHLFQ